uniref:DDE_3 domain-containing protein n=1 Tax=Haemonchus contortus TaxID=6289 RepID=A0A7I4XUD7_HAECO
MVKPSPDRSAIVRLHKAGRPPATIAKHLGIHRSVVYRTLQRRRDLVGLQDHRRSGRPRTARTPKVVESVGKRIARNATRNFSTMAGDMGISRNASNQQARVKKCRQLLLRTRNKGHHSIVYSDEKLFTVEQQFNAQNVRVIARNAEEADKKGRVVHWAAHPAQVMVWAGLKTILEDALIPWAISCFNGRPWTFHQDSAPAHKAKVVQAWCKSELPDFISAEEWPASSPDLNPLDHNLWSYLESKACATPHPNLDSLKAALIREWDEIDDVLLRPVVDAFPKRLRAVVRAKGGRIKK